MAHYYQLLTAFELGGLVKNSWNSRLVLSAAR